MHQYQLTQTTNILRLPDKSIIPADPANSDYQSYLAWIADGNTPQPVDPPTPDRIKSDIVSKTQQRLDAFAGTRDYNSILSACTYATSAVPQFKRDGQYCVNARDETWGKLYNMLAEVEAGTRPMPSGYADIEGELPVLQWPTT